MAKKRNKNLKGFTLVELLAVLVILAVLAALFVPTYAGMAKRATAAVCFQQQAQLQAAFDQYIADPSTPLGQKHAGWVAARTSGVSGADAFLKNNILIPFLRGASVTQMGNVTAVSGETVTLRSPAMIQHGSDTFINLAWPNARTHPTVLLFGVN
jgi:prepilin-type N-terminal cleavage/methylation domain-containing protein